MQAFPCISSVVNYFQFHRFDMHCNLLQLWFEKCKIIGTVLVFGNEKCQYQHN